MSEKQRNDIFWYAKLVGIILAIVTMLGMLTSGAIFVTNMVARTEVLQANQATIAETQKTVLARLNENDKWKSSRSGADTILAYNMRWIYDKITDHDKRLNRLDYAHKFFPLEYGK